MIPLKDLLGAIIGQLQYYGKIGLNNTGGVSQVILNIYLSRVFDTDFKNKTTKRVEVISHKLSE